jgi:hypothetical protein
MAAAASSPSVSACKPRAAAKIRSAPAEQRAASATCSMNALDRAERPVHEIRKRAGVRRKIQSKRDKATGKARETDADQHQARRPARGPAECRDEQRARQARKRQPSHGANDCKAKRERDDGAEGGKAREAEHAGIRQRIAQQSLQSRAGEAERGAREPSRERARETNLPDDGARDASSDANDVASCVLGRAMQRGGECSDAEHRRARANAKRGAHDALSSAAIASAASIAYQASQAMVAGGKANGARWR